MQYDARLSCSSYEMYFSSCSVFWTQNRNAYLQSQVLRGVQVGFFLQCVRWKSTSVWSSPVAFPDDFFCSVYVGKREVLEILKNMATQIIWTNDEGILKIRSTCSKHSRKNLSTLKSALQRDQQSSHGNSKSAIHEDTRKGIRILGVPST